MHWTFEGLNQVFDFLVARSQSCIQGDRGDHKPLSGLGIAAGGQALAEQGVDGALEGVAGATGLFLEQADDVVVEGEGGSRIMMLISKAS